MQVIKQLSKMADFSLKLRRKGRKIGFVPTMGYLHKGHLSLIKQAKSKNDIVVVSIFVNPTQFGPKEDFKNYPRDFKKDKWLAAAFGVDVIFYPAVKNMYPAGYCTYVNVEELTEGLCGASRPGHFKGVATVVAKLFNIVQPDVAYFGQKDAQQAIVIKQMVKDLNMKVKIEALPTVREKDGLAMSSRNVYLSKSERKDALVLYYALNNAKALIKRGEKNSARIITAMRKMINAKKTARIDYVSMVDAGNLKDIETIKSKAIIVLAVKIGNTRLIDNMLVGV